MLTIYLLLFSSTWLRNFWR